MNTRLHIKGEPLHRKIFPIPSAVSCPEHCEKKQKHLCVAGTDDRVAI